MVVGNAPGVQPIAFLEPQFRIISLAFSPAIHLVQHIR